MTANIRTADLSDAAGIARVHVESWQSTYPGIMPEDFLKDLSIEQRTQYWESLLKELPDDQRVVVCTQDSEIVGFASGGPERGQHAAYDGEVYAIYLLEKVQGIGYGQKMLLAIVRSLVENGLNSMLIWVAKENDSRYFYEAMKGEAVAENTIELQGIEIEEIGYGWKDIQVLLE